MTGAKTKMKITDIETIVLESPYWYGMEDAAEDSHGPKYAVLLKVHTDAGITGVADIDSHPHVMKAIMDAPELIPGMSEGLKNALIGENPLEIHRLWKKMYDFSYYHGRRGAAIQAISGVDIALWDIKAKAMGVPVCTAMGARNHDKIKAYASTLFRKTPDAMKRAVDKYRRMGYKAIKFGWASYVENPLYGVELFKAARQEAGDDMDLMVDGYITQNDIKFAARIIRMLEEHNVFWVEEPLPSDNLAGFRQLSTLAHARIAAGEQYGGIEEYAQFIQEGNPDVVQFDLSRCGGLTAARNILFLAERSSKCFCPHAWTSDLLTAASLHINSYGATPLFQEFCTNDSPLSRDLCVRPLTLDAEGCISVPNTPGIGVELNEEIIKKYRIA